MKTNTFLFDRLIDSVGIIVCVIKLRHTYTGRMYAYIYRRLLRVYIRAGTKVKFYIMILSMIFVCFQKAHGFLTDCTWQYPWLKAF